MPDIGVTLTPYFQANTADAVNGFRLRVVASDAVGMPVEIFRHLLQPLQVGQTEPNGQPDGICSPAELQDFPAGEPRSGDLVKWFRLATFELDCQSIAERDEAWQTIQREVLVLQNTLKLMSDLISGVPVRIGDPSS